MNVLSLLINQYVCSALNHIYMCLFVAGSRCLNIKPFRGTRDIVRQSEARRTLKKNGIKDPSGADSEEPLGLQKVQCLAKDIYISKGHALWSIINMFKTFKPV